MFTKISGVTSGPLAERRQKALTFLQECYRVPGMRCYVDLVPEPDNPYDPDAIKVMLGEFHLGYVKNSDTICSSCCSVFERHPSGACPACGRMGTLERCGTATQLMKYFRDNVETPGFWMPDAYISEVTGGGEKSYGANLYIGVDF